MVGLKICLGCNYTISTDYICHRKYCYNDDSKNVKLCSRCGELIDIDAGVCYYDAAYSDCPHAKNKEIDDMIQAENPKDRLGMKKVPLGLLPAAAKIHGAMAMKDGARKYAPYNWRDKKVIMSIYLDAMERHLLAYRDGEDYAEDSGVNHLGHIIACCSIILDAQEIGMLEDDRPTEGPAKDILKFYEDKLTQA